MAAFPEQRIHGARPMPLLRPAAPGDAPALARVHVQSWRAAYRGLMPDAVLHALSEERFAERWRQRLALTARSTMLAVVDGQVAGFGVGGASRDADADATTGELYALYVHPRHWSAGVGRRLWRGMRTWLLAEEFAEATLWVLEENVRARRFYERAGFVLEPGAVRTLEREGAVLPELRYRTRLE